jgi:ketosteroid isomerase-like protein
MTTAHDTNADIVRTLIRAVDDRDLGTIAELTTPDVHFRFGNSDSTDTQADLLTAAETFREAIADQRHTVLDVWEADADTVVATFDVYYHRLDGVELNLPCCNVFRLHDGRVYDYLIYMDANPVFAP